MHEQCDISPDSLTCSKCGSVFHRADVLAHCTRRPGLGDMVAAGLSAVGITKDRVSALVGGDCGCRARQAALNAVGAKYLGLPEGSNGGGDASKTTLDS
jgi:hypothetical protein